MCDRGFAFNMLTKSFELKNAPEIIQFDPKRIRERCLELSNDVELVEGYLPIDFSIIIRRK